jgi:mannan endo-1,4-beta-mannosidase
MNRTFRLFWSFYALVLCSLALLCVNVFAGQVCMLSPARPTASTGFYVAPAIAATSVVTPTAPAPSASQPWKLYDPSGEEFRIRGTNVGHAWDQVGSFTGIAAAGANTARMVMDLTKPADKNLAIVQRMASSGVVPIPTAFSTTCKADQASLAAAVDQWVAQAPYWTQLNGSVMFNIANEWGPGDNIGWRDGYVAAIPRMRAAGYTGTLVVDTGGCGQNLKDVLTWGQDVLAADPLRNILFSVHVYGNFYLPNVNGTPLASWQAPQTYSTAFPRLVASGLPIIIGEFGPGRNIGPSPTLLKPEQLIADAEAAGLGWLAWAWDDNDKAGCQSSDGWFGMAVNCGKYDGADDSTELTLFGRTVVPFLKTSAKRANLVR